MVDLCEVVVEFLLYGIDVFFCLYCIQQWNEIFVDFGVEKVQLFYQLVVCECVVSGCECGVWVLVCEILCDYWFFVQYCVVVEFEQWYVVEFGYVVVIVVVFDDMFVCIDFDDFGVDIGFVQYDVDCL